LGAGSDPGTKLPQLLQRGRSALGDYNQPNISKQTKAEHTPLKFQDVPNITVRGHHRTTTALLWRQGAFFGNVIVVPFLGPSPGGTENHGEHMGKYDSNNHHSIIVLEYVPLTLW